MWQKSSLTRAYDCVAAGENDMISLLGLRAGGGSLVVTSGVEFSISTASRMRILEDEPWIRGESCC